MNRTYKHSGRFTFIGVIAGLVAGLVAAFPLAAVYAWGIIRIPEQHLSAFAALGYGALIGALIAVSAKWGKVRNVQVTAALAVCAAAISYYLSWPFWIKDVFHTFNQEEIDVLALMQRPGGLFGLIKLVNEYGTWGTTEGHPTKGVELWFIWFFEAVAVLGAAAFTAVTVIKAQPFCERCQLWCTKTEKLFLLPVKDLNQAKLLVAKREFSFLQNLRPGKKGNSHLAAELHSCAHCQELNTLTLQQTLYSPRKFASPSVKHVTIADKLLVSQQEADAFRLAAHSIKQLAKAARA